VTPLTLANLEGRLAVVTGGASGIGAEVAQVLAARGAKVIIADVNGERADSVAEAIGGQGRTVDVCDRAQVARLFATLEQAPAILVTCAGGATRRPALEVDEAMLRQTFDLNAGGFWRCTQEAARRCIAADAPLSVVHLASSLHRGPAPELSHFAAAKAASITMVRCLAQELATHNIRVNAVIPGPIETASTTPVWDARPELRAALSEKLPLGRIGQPIDVAPAVAWLASDEASWITGAVLNVDGGLSVAP
jgi:NAD(P)-dependent dehydrogenase (short-subunit alcohol dehydrogenase family)